THLALVVILLGALVSEQFKSEGSLALWEGQQSARYFDRMAGDQGAQSQASLPFEVRLDSFEIETYPGTRRPAQFRSRVTVTDYQAGITFPAVIQMNEPLTYRGWRLFQSSYQQQGGREMSILTVSKDPGKLIVYIGYFLLMGGMATVIGTRVVQRRAAARYHARKARTEDTAGKRAQGGPPHGGSRKPAPAVVALPLLLCLAGALLASPALAAGPVPDADVVETLRTLPVQHDGRTMPLDTMAREAVWNVTGESGGWEGLDPVAVVLGWTFHSREWTDEPMVKLGDRDLAAAAGLDPARSHASFREIARSDEILRLFADARQAAGGEEDLPPQLEAAQKLESRLLWAQGFFGRESLRTIPVAGDPGARWSKLSASVDSPRALSEWSQRQWSDPPRGYPTRAEMEREVLYNDVHPTRLSWIILAVATLASLAALRSPSRVKDVIAVVALLAGVAVMTWGIAMRWDVADRIPASNMYESMLFLGWGVGLFALIAAAVMRNRLVIFNAAAMSLLTMALVDLLPIDPFVHPMAPVLSGTPWLAIHVPIIMVSYSVLALGVLIAHMQIGIEIFRPGKREAAARMNDLLYWYMHVGSLLLVAGIITGSIWAASSWGRYWGWDPKEVWSLIAFLAYMGILHARFDRQIHAFGVAAASIVAFWTVLMTYIGVNFVLSAGLHSYGFGSGGVVQWMAIIGAAEVAFLTLGYAASRRNRKNYGPLPAAGV
ncbi:MAG: cytochrome c biogenesis protein CcsA, partial [Acidobacteriota bacterium]